MAARTSRAANATAVAAATGRRAAPRRTSPPVTPDYVEALKQYSRLLYDGGLHGGKDAKRPEALAAKIAVGRDLGIPDTQAIAWIMIVGGRPTIWGDLGMAMIRTSGLMDEEHLKEWYEGEGDDYTACFQIKRVGPTPARTSRFSVADAKRAKLWGKAGPWTEYPERQLMWRAKSWACRDEFQDVLCGLVFTEEAMDGPGSDDPPIVVHQAAKPIAGPAPTPADSVSGQPEAAAAETTATTRAGTETFSLTGPVTQDQLEELARIRDLAFVALKLEAEEDQDAAWGQVLADYDVTSARDLTAAQAQELAETLGRKYDPFTYGPSQPAGQQQPTPAPEQPSTTAAA